MTIGSLFSGIGGLEMGLEMCGVGPVIWQAESDPFARAVLAKHWPDVRRYNDVREIDAQSPPPEIICGGFPCQDISDAGLRVGIDGERSGLWREFARIIRALRPRLVFVENVAALTVRGLGRVLGDLAALGFDAEWEVFLASDVGAPHRRERIFILAYAASEGRRRAAGLPVAGDRASSAGVGPADARRCGGIVADSEGNGCGSWRAGGFDSGGTGESERAFLADALRGGRGQNERDVCAGQSDVERSGEDVADPDGGRREVIGIAQPGGQQGEPGSVADRCGQQRYEHSFPPGPTGIAGWPGPQPAIRRGDDGVPGRSHRLRVLGNAVVPQQAALAFQTLTARAAARGKAAA